MLATFVIAAAALIGALASAAAIDVRTPSHDRDHPCPGTC
jgi:hypothetical protein